MTDEDGSGRQVPISPLYAQRPKPRILKRPTVVLGMAVLLAGAVGLMVWNAQHNAGSAATPPPAGGMTGWGTTGLDRGYTVREERPTPPPPPKAEEKPPPQKPADPPKPTPPRSRDVLWGKNGQGDRADQFPDPNVAIARRHVEWWASAEAEEDAAAVAATGCVLKGGTTFEAQQRGGMVQVLRPVYGTDATSGETCLAIRPGATLVVEPQDRGKLCATRLNLIGGASRDIGCWEMMKTNEERSQRAAVYAIRTVSDFETEA